MAAVHGQRLARDLRRGVEARRFPETDVRLLNHVIGGAVWAVMRAKLVAALGPDADAELAATVLRMVGLPPREAREIAWRPLPDIDLPARERRVREDLAMAFHRLLSVTLGVPDVAAASGFYRDFGLAEALAGVFATAIGGEQLRLEPATGPLRELAVAVDDPDDLDRVAARLAALDVPAHAMARPCEPVTAGAGCACASPRAAAAVVPEPRLPENAPGRVERANRPAEGVLRDAPVRPTKLSHVALARPTIEATTRFFTAASASP